jgi:hypothetical protein
VIVMVTVMVTVLVVIIRSIVSARTEHSPQQPYGRTDAARHVAIPKPR